MGSTRISRKSLFTLLILLLISCAVYFVASGEAESLATLPMKSNLNSKFEPIRHDVHAAQKPKAPDAEGKVVESIALEETKEETKEETESLEKYTETPFMPKMANETLKAALGNSAWHLLHTILARYPDKPSEQEKSSLKSYVYFFGQVYPCGDCARHFQKILAKYPVQTGSRKTAALWGCHVHNKVNERLNKPEYDCTTILEDYDCGCGDDEKQEDATLDSQSLEHLREITVDEKPGRQLGG